jgi:phosphotransacetylase
MRIVFPEGDDARIREAADFLEANGLANVTLLTGIDDLAEAYRFVTDDEADAVIARGATAGQANTFLILERVGKHGKPERVILTDSDSIQHFDPEKLLGIQPRITIFPGEEQIVEHFRAAHPLWLVGNAFKLDDINVLMTSDIATRDALATVLRQFAGFRVFGPFSPASGILAADFSSEATVADIIGTAECLAKLAA